MTHEQWIFHVVERFYDKAKIDVLIGYHFRNIHDFEAHIPRIAAFWELQLLGKTARKLDAPFDLIKVHIPLGIKRGELGRWLVLFRKTLDEETTEDKKVWREEWEEKLKQFEGIFLRFFGL